MRSTNGHEKIVVPSEGSDKGDYKTTPSLQFENVFKWGQSTN